VSRCDWADSWCDRPGVHPRSRAQTSPLRCTGPGDGDNSIVHALVNTRCGGCSPVGTRFVGDILRSAKEAAMCTWSPRNPAQSRSNLRKQKKYHYVWDLDDGVPRLASHTKRDRLKLFVDSDGDGLFTKADALVGRARIFRGQGRGQLLEGGSFGTILTFMHSNPALKVSMATFQRWWGFPSGLQPVKRLLSSSRCSRSSWSKTARFG
jgi:hypothetical protein